MMQSIFEGGVLERIAGSDALVAFDFDGTLAPIVDEPPLAAMRPATRHLLAEAARLYPCAVVSGRPEEDVLRLLDGVTVWYVIGNRALQPPQEAERRRTQVAKWLPLLSQSLAHAPGVVIEDKSVSLALHYRKAPERERARAAIIDAVKLLEDAPRMIDGNNVVNLLPANGPNKGTAIRGVREQIGCASVLYVGDDRSDEDVFELSGVVGVRIGEAGDSRAGWFLRGQADVDELLERLIALRPRRVPRQELASHPALRRT
jgi:trehalose 6-phosphate phosphatase